MATRGRPKKQEFEDVPSEFKDQANSSSREELQNLISLVSCNQVELMKLKSEDSDLATAKEVAKQAGAVYAEGSKLNKAKILYCKTLLDDKGGHTKS